MKHLIKTVNQNLVGRQRETFYSEEELQKVYQEEINELKRLEAILDNLFMAKKKDQDWSDKNKIAQGLHKETKEKIDFLNTLLPQSDLT